MEDFNIMDKTIYQHSAAYAKEHGEIETYIASRRLSLDCRDAIEKAVNDHYDGFSLERGAVKQVLNEFSMDRTQQVLAISIQLYETDGRISRDNVSWANSVPVVPDIDQFGNDHNRDLAVYQIHPGILNLFTKMVRDEALILSKPPFYQQSSDYARANGELEQYRLSRNVNVLCAKEMDETIQEKWDGMHIAPDAARDVLQRFGPERVAYVLASTVLQRDWDERFSNSSRQWAKTIPMCDPENRRSSFELSSHSVKLDEFIHMARREMLAMPLTRNDIKAEAAKILAAFQEAREPNSPNKTHFLAQISPDFLARAKTKDTDRLMSMLPFQSLSFSTLEGRKGTFALIIKDENCNVKLQLRKPSVRKKLQEQADAPTTTNPPSKRKGKEQAR